MEIKELEEKIKESLKKYKEANPSKELFLKILSSLPVVNDVTEAEVDRYFSSERKEKSHENFGRVAYALSLILFKFKNMYKYAIPVLIAVVVFVGFKMDKEDSKNTMYVTPEELNEESAVFDSMNDEELEYLDAELSLLDVDAELEDF